jgi:predicted phosphodiesterase
MENSREQYHREIHELDGYISHRVLAIIKKHKLPYSMDALEKSYRRWAQKIETNTEFKNSELNNDELDKLEHKLIDFDIMVNELQPQHNQYGLPESLESSYSAYKLPNNHNNILLLSDIHVPYHNIEALTAALRYGLEHEVNTILLNGDVIDFYAISRFEKDPRKRNFGHEVLMTREFLQSLRRLFPHAAIYYKCGNHDARYDYYIMRNAPDLLGVDEFSFQSLMHLDKLNIEFVPDKQIIHAGKLTILHGHELGSSVFSPVNIARGLYLKAKDSALCGHHHQASEHNEPNINGKLTTCWSVACLCELHPDYLPINKHHHGFAHVQVLDNEDFEVSNYRIINGKIR